MRAILTVAAGLTAVVMLASCTPLSESGPVHAREPALQSARLIIAPAKPPRCPIVSPFRPARRAEKLVTVDPNPLGGALLWYPGRYPQGPCRVERTPLPEQAARLIAADIRNAAPSDRGDDSCPTSVGQEIDVYLFYAGQPEPEVVRVHPGDCNTVDAPARTHRTFPAPLRSDLRAIAPMDYRASV